MISLLLFTLALAVATPGLVTKAYTARLVLSLPGSNDGAQKGAGNRCSFRADAVTAGCVRGIGVMRALLAPH
jgi:hypothetical protein